MLALLVLLVVGTVGAVAVRLPDLAEPRGTEFFVTDTEGALPAVPLNATPGEPLALRVHVVEHREPRAFSVAAAFEGQAGRAGSWNLTATPEQETTLAIAVPAPAAPGSAWLDLRLLDENGHELRSLRLLLDVERP